MIKLITDSTSDIEKQEAEKYGITIVPLKVIMEGNDYRDRVDLNAEDFYPLLEQCDNLPTTSQPSPQDFLTIYEKAKEANDSIIVITLSSAISGTYQSACIAKDLLDYEDVHIIDSLNATQGLHILVKKAVQLIQEGKEAKDIVSFLEEYKKRIHIFAVVDTLEYFYKGGRLSKTSAAMGTLLKFKPVVGLKEGKLELFDKARGTMKATAKILELIQEHGEIDLQEPIFLGYTGTSVGLDKFCEQLRDHLLFTNEEYGIVGPVIGTHAGPGAKLIAYVNKA